MRNEMTGGSTSFDQEIWKEIENVIKTNNISIQDVLESFSLFTRRVNFTKLLIFHELFLQVKDLPGSIVELGVYRGNVSSMFAKFLEIYCTGDRFKKVIGFDNFSGFQSFSEEDGDIANNRGKLIGGWNSGDFKDALLKMFEIHTKDSFLPRAPRTNIIEGDICETVPKFSIANPGFRISLLHLNCNLYQPTRIALEEFYPKIVPGGIVVCAEYGITEWAGETKAIEEYFKGKLPDFKRLGWHAQPNCYFIKPHNQ
jgi:hypothetical protein